MRGGWRLSEFKITWAEVDDGDDEEDQCEDGTDDGANHVGRFALSVQHRHLFGVSDDPVKHLISQQ